jgi:hypothetical protein
MTNGEIAGTFYLTPSPGEVEEPGTPQSATNFGNMDYGILESELIGNFLVVTAGQQSGQIEALIGQQFDVTLTNTQKYPATNGTATIALTKYLNNTDYQLNYKILSQTGGFVEDIQFYDLATNGFKVKYFGSATSVNLRIYVTGGM